MSQQCLREPCTKLLVESVVAFDTDPEGRLLVPRHSLSPPRPSRSSRGADRLLRWALRPFHCCLLLFIMIHYNQISHLPCVASIVYVCVFCSRFEGT